MAQQWGENGERSEPSGGMGRGKGRHPFLSSRLASLQTTGQLASQLRTLQEHGLLVFPIWWRQDLRSTFLFWSSPPPPPLTPDTYLCLLKLAHGFECSSLLLSPGGTPHLKRVGMFVVPLRGVDFGFWSHLGCSGQNAIIFSWEGLV